VLLVDDGSVPIDDRVWASWRPVGDDPEDPTVSLSWRRLAIATEHGERVLGLRHHRYVAVRGRDLRAAADAALSSIGGERLEATAYAVREDGDAAVVSTSAGDVRAVLVLDSVGLLAAESVAPQFWMTFQGVEVETDCPAFDPGLVRLMDFRVPQRGGTAFLYTLPSAADRALVEYTRITADTTPNATAPFLAHHLDVVLGPGRYRVVRREAGRVPLRHRRQRPRSAHCLAIGETAGLVKASTGYGYEQMRRDGARIAEQLRLGEPPTGLGHKSRHVAMDAIFLELAVRDPGTMTTSLELLFARNSADDVLRFLDERLSLREEAGLVSSLPVAPFVEAALRTAADEVTGRRRRFRDDGSG
jgi:lycopene beta-cyclase